MNLLYISIAVLLQKRYSLAQLKLACARANCNAWQTCECQFGGLTVRSFDDLAAPCAHDLAPIFVIENQMSVIE